MSARVALGILSDMWCCTGKPCGAGSPANSQFWAFHFILSTLERLPSPDLSGFNFTQRLVQPRKMFWALNSTVASQILTQPPGEGKRTWQEGCSENTGKGVSREIHGDKFFIENMRETAPPKWRELLALRTRLSTYVGKGKENVSP